MRPSLFIQGVIAVAVILLDQASKAVVRARFELFDTVPVIPGFFDLTRVHNTGTAFGMFNAVDIPYKALVLALVGLASLAGLALYSVSLPAEHRMARVGLAGIIGGAIGNLVDRITLGYVVDFFDFYWRGWHFWAFNIADAAISVGLGLLLLDLFLPGRTHATHPS
ncbi:MAG: signal peptidase II [Vicinamibacterales bacterium]